MQYRTGNLHWLLQPDKEHPLFGWACIARMVKPWDEWLFIVLPERGKELDFEPTNEQWLGRMKEFIGDDSIDTEILGVSKWRINDVVAEEFSRGRVYVFDISPNYAFITDAVQILFGRCGASTPSVKWSRIQYVYPGRVQPSVEDCLCAER